MKYFFTFLTVLNCMLIFGQQKSIEAQRLDGKISMDGYLTEDIWKKAQPAVDFLERNPTEGKAPRFETEVRVVYTDYAIYVGAMMYDNAPDSILKQLGERDEDLNADNFSVSFDPYNQNLDAFVFSVSASGVQGDFKYSDMSFNAVWHSHVKILENGWSVEMEIPFSALRFPNDAEMVWKIQFEREIRRTRSLLQWSLVSKNYQNEINYWGVLKGLKSIKNPIRLQFSPYLSSSWQSINAEQDFAYGGGADVKYGLSEAFTLDMTLLPDFSQVLSDNQIKNLSAFEVVFAEQRPFFQEGVDLFTRGNMFYSRRIGGRPLGYFDVYATLDSNEVVSSNPNTSKLINVSKISGRNKKGTGIGFLNALTAETFATITNSETNEDRQVMTNPLVNYNIFTFDQNLKNNSSFFITNLNTTRANGFSDANNSGAGINLVTPSNAYSFNASAKITQVEDTLSSSDVFHFDKKADGLNYFAMFSKIKGEFRASISTDNISPFYNPNDLGAYFLTNYRFHRLTLRYNKYNPFWIVNQWYNSVTYGVDQNYTTNQVLKHTISANSFTTHKSFHSFYANVESQIGDGIDLFESRVDGKPFIYPGYAYLSLGISSDYRKKVAIDANFGNGYGDKYYGTSWYRDFRFAPIIRFTDKFTLRPSIDITDHKGGVGFAGYDELGNPVYGRRNVLNVENILSGKYLFKNNLSLTLRVRHYWSKGKYLYLADLSDEGLLVRNDNINYKADFNFNAFNVDCIFAWQVAPGSFLNVVYKSALISDEKIVVTNYFSNLSYLMDQNPAHTITVKFIYFIDVASVKKGKK